MPSVSIHAPVLRAAVISPLLKACFTLGGRVKFSAPPWTVSSSLGLSICHSLSISWSSTSGFESTATRTYWTGNTWSCLGLRGSLCFSQVLLVWLFLSILSYNHSKPKLVYIIIKRKISVLFTSWQTFTLISRGCSRVENRSRVIKIRSDNCTNNHFFFG